VTGRLIHTGQVMIDLVLRIPSMPARGGDVLASEMALTPGGGFNVMAAAARSGADVVYAGAHGTGGFGDVIRAALAAEGVTATQAPSESSDTGVAVALVEKDGERTFVTGTGAEAHLQPAQLDAVGVGPADLVYVSGYSLLYESNREALLAWLPRLPGSRVLFDPGPLGASAPADVLGRILSTVDVLSCNAPEARALAGVTDLDGAARLLAGRLAAGAVVVVRDGPAGCLIRERDETTTVPAFAVDAVDTNGAGDAHCGVLAAELLHGTAPADAALRANAAAALSVTRHGPATAPTRAEIDKLLLSRQ
jgi:sugar/nucleoside kinase (ribokinase family)